MKRKPKKSLYELIFTDAELCQWFDWFNHHWYLPTWTDPAFYFALVVCSGLRRDEARLLRVEWCLLHPLPIIHVHDGKGSKNREVELIPQFRLHYETRLVQLKEARKEYVFAGRRGKKPPALRTIKDWWDKVTQAAGIRSLSPLAGRRSFATYAPLIPIKGTNGNISYISLNDLKGQLGHEDIYITAYHYNQSIPGHRFDPDKPIEWPEHV